MEPPLRLWLTILEFDCESRRAIDFYNTVAFHFASLRIVHPFFICNSRSLIDYGPQLRQQFTYKSLNQSPKLRNTDKLLFIAVVHPMRLHPVRRWYL